MDVTQLFLNDQLVTITAESSIVKRLNEDDTYLAEYVNKAAKLGQFNFIFKDQPVRKIVVRRATVPVNNQVWTNKMGNCKDVDSAAVGILLKLRMSDKYSSRFKDEYAVPIKIWEDIATEMKHAGYEVDGGKCEQKFHDLKQNYYKYKKFIDSCTCHDRKMDPPECYDELRKIFGDDVNGNGDIETKKQTEVDLIQKYLKKNHDQSEEHFQQLYGLIQKRTDLMKEKMKQNEKVIAILEKFLSK